MTNKIFVLAILVLLAGLPVSMAQLPPGFGYDCQGYVGYGYECSSHHEPARPLDVGLSAGCDKNAVTVTYNGNTVSGAHVSVKDVDTADLIASGETDADGKFAFEGCGMKVDVKASKSGYLSDLITESLISCLECKPPECTSDAQCPSDKQCVEEKCVPVPCECGAVRDHQCAEYACCSNSDCPQEQICDNHVCTPKPPEFECRSDGNCAATKYCDIKAGAAGGSCKDVSVGDCGQISNHQFVPFSYECGTEAGCPTCVQGSVCIEHKCVASDVTCPSTGLVGDSKSCQASENGQACSNCDYQVTDPTGKNFTGQTDENGNFNLPLNTQGTYEVALLKNGQVVKIIQIKALPQAAPGENGNQTATGGDGLSSLLWLFAIVILIVLGIVYWRSRGGRR